MLKIPLTIGDWFRSLFGKGTVDLRGEDEEGSFSGRIFFVGRYNEADIRMDFIKKYEQETGVKIKSLELVAVHFQ